MSRWVAWVSVAALFLSGVSIGALGVQLYRGADRPPLHRRQPPGDLRDGGPPHERSIHRMEERLELSPEQRASVDSILERSRRESDRIRRELRPRLEGLADRTREEIAGVLTDEQREAFDEFQRQLGRGGNRFFLDGGPGGPLRPGRRPDSGPGRRQGRP